MDGVGESRKELWFLIQSTESSSQNLVSADFHMGYRLLLADSVKASIALPTRFASDNFAATISK